jgi:ABC-type antimicrobial peptide transport system permease subunit
MINQALAGRLWPGEDPLGRRLRISGDQRAWLEVVGVAGNAKDDDLTANPRAYFYLPVEQEPSGALSLVARTTSDPRARLAAAAGVARSLDPDLPLVGQRTFEDLLDDNIDKQRATASMLGVFGTLALVLATMGIYGVASHAARLRTREVGIRMALGAREHDVHRLFISKGLRLSIVGVGIGMVMSVLSLKLVASFVFGLNFSDAVVFAGAAVVLCAAAVLANYLPARRAANVDPLLALRSE